MSSLPTSSCCRHVVVAVGLQNRWIRRRKIILAELADEPWFLSPPRSWNHTIVRDAFGALGLDPPKIALNRFICAQIYSPPDPLSRYSATIWMRTARQSG